MVISKIQSKKHGNTYQVDIRYKNTLGISKRHIKNGFQTLNEAKKYEKDFKEQLEVSRLQEKSTNKTFNDIYYEYMKIEGEGKYARSTKIYYNETHRMYVKDIIGHENMGSLSSKKSFRAKCNVGFRGCWQGKTNDVIKGYELNLAKV